MHHELHTQVDIDATPETVWSLLTDLDHYAEWNPFIVEASGDVAVGNRLTNRMQPPGGKAMTIKPAVTAVEPAQTFEWLGHLGVRGVFDGRHRSNSRRQHQAEPESCTLNSSTACSYGSCARRSTLKPTMDSKP